MNLNHIECDMINQYMYSSRIYSIVIVWNGNKYFF